MNETNHRIRYKKDNFEVEVQGDKEWVGKKFKELTKVKVEHVQANAELEGNRKALLKFYSSQTMTHGGYIIALLVGFFAVVELLDSLPKLLFYVMFSLFVSADIYIAGRILWYGCLSHVVLTTDPINDPKPCDWFERKIDKMPSIYQLHHQVGYMVSYIGKGRNGKKGGCWYKIANLFRQLNVRKIVVLLVLSGVVSSVLYLYDFILSV